ncbi:MAG: diguanylate cyclase (GGDEF)-like protein/PAS domain S-box-containing protein [Burkholderiaceae bacterium]|jgi:diguanylate cyclase (GGDEF)-like protein/PAS domain S-box-containing protein
MSSVNFDGSSVDGEKHGDFVNVVQYQHRQTLLNTGALQAAIFNSANFSSIATDAKGVIQIFNVGAERMLGYPAAEVVNKITPADISDPQEVLQRAAELSIELDTPITPGFEALVFKASRDIEDIYALTYIRKDGSRFPAIVSVTALRDEQDTIIGYLLIGTDNTARKQAELALVKAGALQNAIYNSANFSSIATDANGVIQIFNVGAQRMLGYTAAEVVNKITPADISDPQEVVLRAAALSVELNTPITPGFEALVFKASRGIEDIYALTYVRKDGSRFPAILSVTALRDDRGAIIGYLLIGTDNTARNQIENERTRIAQRLAVLQFYTRSLIESSLDALVAINPYGIITDLNKQMEVLTGCTRDELIGAPFKLFFTDPSRAEIGINLVLKENKVTDFELTARSREGKETVVSYNASTYYDRDRRLEGVFVAARDITGHKHAEEQLRLALHDKLTGLPNRQLFIDRLMQSMAASQRTGMYGAMMFLDMDHFKPLNDTHGHDFGDLLLIEVAHRLKKCVREMDDVGRFGGDEFVVMISPLNINLATSILQAGVIAEKISSALAEPYRLMIMQNSSSAKTVEHRCTVSIGVALFLGHKASHEEIIKQADTAMYQSKEAGRNRVHFYESLAV